MNQWTLELPGKADWLGIGNILFVVLLALLGLFFGLQGGSAKDRKKRTQDLIGQLSLFFGLGMWFAGGWTLSQLDKSVSYKFFADMLLVDFWGGVACSLILFLAGVACLLVPTQLHLIRHRHYIECYVLITMVAVGAMLTAMSQSWILFFISLQLSSLASYLLSLYNYKEPSSQEAGLKYFLTSSAASGIFLYGSMLLYGVTGSTWVSECVNVLQIVNTGTPLHVIAQVALLLIFVGIAFKLALVPLHFWSPDVYEGTPTLFAGVLSTLPKVGMLMVLHNFSSLLYESGFASTTYWSRILMGFAILSIFYGNIAALGQTSLKRILAFSSVAQAGYLVIGPLSGFGSNSAFVFYLMAYTTATLAIFGCILFWERALEAKITLENLSLAGTRNPLVTMIFCAALLSLAGVPPMGGFFGKFILFRTGIESGLHLLVVIAIVGSIVSVGYYGRMLFTSLKGWQEREEVERVEPKTWALLSLVVVNLMAVFFWP